MSRIALSVVLPTYDERGNVLELLERIERSLGGWAYEILVVDDDSPDGTADEAERYAASHPAVRVLRRRGTRGLRSAIQDGIDASLGTAVAWMDGDLSMPPELLPELARATAAATDVAVGSRYVAGGADERDDVPVHRLFSRLLNGFLRLLLGSQVTDYTSGFVCARRAVLERVRLRGEYGEYCIDLLHRARTLGYRVVELPYRNTPRHAGASKTAAGIGGLLRRGTGYLATAVRLRREVGR